MSETNDGKPLGAKTEAGLNALLKGSQSFHNYLGHNYYIKIYDSSKSCAVSIVNKSGTWIARLDRPHPWLNSNHININSKISGFKDPHINVPPGSIYIGTWTAKAVKNVNKVALPLAIAIDGVIVVKSMYSDFQNNSTRNTAESVASVAGGWGGGYGGAVAGAAMGTALIPGVGTFIGGIVGGIVGGLGGSIGAVYVVDTFGDAYDYDIEEVECKQCEQRFKRKKYKGQQICPKCSESQCLTKND